MATIAGLYALTPDLLDTDELITRVTAAIAGGAAAVQYRNKIVSPPLRRAQALALRELLLPRTTILTPNSTEARRLADGEDDEEPSLAICAQRLIESGCGHVLITGTHEATAQVVNTLYGKAGLVRSDSWERLPGSYHGSGCTLASAIAAMLANGLELPEAVREAQDYTWHALAKAYRPGMGQFLPDRLFWARDDDAEPPVEEERASRAPNLHRH